MSLIKSLDAFRRRNPVATTTVRGRRWHFIDTAPKGSANKPVLLMLPGTLGSADIFWNQITALKSRARIIALSYPLVADVDLIVGDLKALLDRLDIDRASVVGSSFGGFTAQALARAHPARIKTLFIGNSLTDMKLIAAGFPSAAELIAMPPKALRAQMSAQIGAWAGAMGRSEVGELLIRDLHHHLPPRGPKLRLAAIMAAREIPVARVEDSQIVIIDSADDPLILENVRLDVRARYPGAKLHALDHGGHFPYLTRPEIYNTILENGLG